MLGVFNKHRINVTSGITAIDPNNERYNSTACPLVAWYDFSDLSTMYTDAGTTSISANGDSIYRIVNKARPNVPTTLTKNSLGSFLEQSTSGSRPQISITGARPQEILARFDGLDDFLECTRAIGNQASGSLSLSVLNMSALTMFAVFGPDTADPSGNESIFGFMDAAESYGALSITNAGTGLINKVAFKAIDNVARTDAHCNSGITNTTGRQGWYVKLNCDNDETTSKIHKDGVKAGATNQPGEDHALNMGTDNGNVAFTIGCVPQPSARGEFFDGGIHEVLIYQGLLTDNRAAEIVAYLTNKYNLTISN